jgi:hypothetical protein
MPDLLIASPSPADDVSAHGRDEHHRATSVGLDHGLSTSGHKNVDLAELRDHRVLLSGSSVTVARPRCLWLRLPEGRARAQLRFPEDMSRQSFVLWLCGCWGRRGEEGVHKGEGGRVRWREEWRSSIGDVQRPNSRDVASRRWRMSLDGSLMTGH